MVPPFLARWFLELELLRLTASQWLLGKRHQASLRFWGHSFPNEEGHRDAEFHAAGQLVWAGDR